MKTLVERLETDLLGQQINLECEEAVVEYLNRYKILFDQGDSSPSIIRRVYQLVASKKIVKELKQKIEDLEYLIGKQTT